MRLFNIRSIIFIILLILSVALYFFTEARYAALLIVLLLLILIGAVIIANVTGRQLRASLVTPVQGMRGQPARISIKAATNRVFPYFFAESKQPARIFLLMNAMSSVSFFRLEERKKRSRIF